MLVLITREANLSLIGLFFCYSSTDTIMEREEKFSQDFENTNLCCLNKGNKNDDNRRHSSRYLLSPSH